LWHDVFDGADFCGGSSFEVALIVRATPLALMSDPPPANVGARSPSAEPDSLQQAFADIRDDLVAGAPLADCFERAMTLLGKHLNATRAALFVGDAAQRRIAVHVAYGMERDALRPRYGAGVAGRVTESALPIVVPVVRQEPMALSELTAPSTWQGDHLSLVAVPVLVDRRCVGALSVYFARGAPGTFPARLAVVQRAGAALSNGLRVGRAAPAVVSAPPANTRAAFEYANMVGHSAAMRQVYEEIGQVAPTTATALILGESGTGKELVAHAIHANSDRAAKPFIKINSAAFPETLFEAELFGYERGAFTGAAGRKIGRLDRAQGGTLFLDEIGDIPLSTQVKLLRVLQSREYERLGATETLKADVRVIAATNKDLAAAVASGTFREDLFYRLNVFTITLPPLRDRREDLPALAQYFLEKYRREHRRDIRGMTSGALVALAAYSWPGNVRELENAVERAVVSCPGTVVDECHLPKTVRAGPPGGASAAPLTLAQAVEELERRMIGDALRESQGNLAQASRRLGTTERILRYKVGKYGLRASSARGRG
jgi:Nif-specific regulatory protein